MGVEDVLTWPSPELAERPYVYYEQLRRERPVWQSPQTGEFLISRWADVAAIVRAPHTFGQYGAGSPINGMAASDDLIHRDKRAAVPQLVPPVLEDRIRALAEARAGCLDTQLVASFARLFPAEVLCDVLGFPVEDAQIFVDAFGASDARASRLVSSREMAMAAERMNRAAAHVETALFERRRAPRDDALSAWLARTDGSGMYAVQYLTTEILFLFFAGSMPVTHLIATTVVALLQNPDALDQVRRDPSLTGAAVEEALRLDPPIQWLNRVALRDTELGGIAIPAGATLVLLWGSAARDEERYQKPAEFRLDRHDPARLQLAFGHGRHACLGAPLARLQSRIAVEALLDRLIGLRLAAPVAYEIERTPTEVELVSAGESRR